MKSTDVLIVGGGASGLCAAISAARCGASVTIAERLPRVGKKILSTGNGRCNITNRNIDLTHYHGQNPSFAKSALLKFSSDNTLSFFESIGLPCICTENGKMYPQNLQASSVLDLLRLECTRLGVIELTDFNVSQIKLSPFCVVSDKGEKIICKSIILAAGGKSAPSFGTDGSAYNLATDLGHTLVRPFPSLVQLKVQSPIRSLKGIKHICKATVVCDKIKKDAYGEVMFTEYGLSGPPIFDLSRIASYGIYNKKDVYIYIDLLPDVTDLKQNLSNRAKLLPDLYGENFLNGILNKRLGAEICKRSSSLSEMSELIHNFTFKISGTMPWSNSQVTAGGIDVSDIDPNTMESRLIKNLFFAGEILDIDGDCGGYNLQWAWSSGYIAGQSAANCSEANHV